MATAKLPKPPAYKGEQRDAQTVDTWLTKMTTYLELTNTAEADRVKIASAYLEDTAYDWYVGEQASLTTFDMFKSSLRAHFVPQNHRDVAYRRYKALKQDTLSVSDYSIQLRTLANQIKDLVPEVTLHLDFVEGLNGRIKRFMVAQVPSAQETWPELVGRALRQEETLPADYNRPPKAAAPSNAAQRTVSRIQTPGPRPGSRPSNWTPKPPSRSASKPNSNSLDPLSEAERAFLMKHEGCFRCRRTYVTHIGKDCPGIGRTSGGSGSGGGKTSLHEDKTVKEEINFISEAEDSYQYEEPSDCYNVPPIVLPIQLDDTVPAEGLIDPGSSSDLISEKLVLQHPTRLKTYPTRSPSLLHHALESRRPVRISRALTTHLKFSPPTGLRVKTKSPTTLRVAPLASHDVVLGMPFLTRNDLLVDPVSRSVIPREDIARAESKDKQSPECLSPESQSSEPPSLESPEGYRLPRIKRPRLPVITDQVHFVKVGNALMQVSEATARSVSHHIYKRSAKPASVFTHRLSVRLACCALADEFESRYKELHTAFIKQYADVFSTELPSRLPPKGGPTHRIILKDNQPINGKLMRVPTKYWPALRRFIDANLKAGRLRPSSSHISAGTFLVPKKNPDADPRVVHDYRALNEKTVKDHTPLPRQDEILELLVRAVVRGKIDLVNAFYQILVEAGDIHKTAIKTPFGLYEWTVMPQGLCNAPATFQRFMNYVLREYIGKICAVYQDDIAIFSNSIEEHKRNVHLILQALRNHGITASVDKSILFADRIEFLGHFISSKGIEADPAKLEKVANWPTPTSASQILEFNGLVNYLAMFDFVPGLADHSAILTDLTRKGVPFRWEKKHEDAFRMIKKLARSVRFLQRIDYESGDPIWLIADVSNRGVGGYVAQGQNWRTARPIGFYSRQYRPAEVNYPTHEQEMLAIISCMKHWYPQLTGTHFTVLSDHAPLQYWKTQRDLSKRQIRWLDFLSNFDFDIKYIPGITNRAADALSRYPYAQPNKSELNSLATTTHELNNRVTDEIRTSYFNDPFFKPIVSNPQQYPHFFVHKGLVYLHDGRLCIPNSKSTREMLLYQHHDNEDHFGNGKVYASLSSKYFWPGLSKEVRKYIASCTQCLRNKPSNQTPAGLLHPLPIPEERFSDIAMDFISPLPKSNGFDSVLVITDRLTNYIRIEPTYTTATAPDIASLVYRTWCRQFGLPRRIVSDRDKLFMSAFWKALHKLLGIKLLASTAYHPQTDGSSERSNRTAIQALRNYVNQRQTDWADHLIHVETAMNNSVNVTTELTPTELLYGSPIRLFPALDKAEVDEARLPGVTSYVDRIAQSISIAKDNHLVAKTNQTRKANRSWRPDPDYKAGDMVMLDSRNIRRRIKKNGRSAKFYPRFLGPFKIVRAQPDTSNYELELLPKVDFETIHPNFHVSLLRPHIPNDPEQFPNREPPRPGPVIPDDPDGAQYTVEKLIDHRPAENPRQYLVRWEGYDESSDQWVNKGDIHRDLIWDYHNSITK